LTAPTAKPKPSAAVETQTPAKNSEQSAPSQATQASIAAPNLVSKEEKPKPEATTPAITAKAEASKEVASNTTESTPRPSTPASPNPPSKIDRTFNTVAHGARLYRGLHRIHRGTSRLISVLAPQWDIDDWQDGDEDFSDNDDDDEEDDERYDSDDNENDEKHDADSEDTRGERNAAAKGVATSTATNIASLNPPRSRAEISEKKTESTANTSPPTSDKTPVITEKEVPAGDIEKSSSENPAAVEGKNLERRYKDWSRYIIWAIMIMFPFLFMGEWCIRSNIPHANLSCSHWNPGRRQRQEAL
jgi:hypothetical protein